MIFFRKAAIIGAGLLGGSLAMALKKAKAAEKISAWSRSVRARERCSELKGVFDEVCETPTEAVADADLVVLCTPTNTIPEISESIAPFLKEGALVTDVGSVKSGICKKCSEIFGRAHAKFVGSHPMAGSEKIGIYGADEKLFEGRICFVTEGADTETERKISGMWEGLGMKVFRVSAREHDAIVARVSHLPHLASALLCLEVDNFKTSIGEAGKFSGPGLRDTTRVSSGSPEMWMSIIRDNTDEILSALKSLSRGIQKLESDIETGNFSEVERTLKRAKSFRDSL